MNVNNIIQKIIVVKQDLQNMQDKYDMTVISRFRHEYNNAIRKKVFKYIPEKKKEDLRCGNTVYKIYKNKEKSHEDLQKKYAIILDGCQNFKRKETFVEYTGVTPYELRFLFHSHIDLKKRHFFRFVEIAEYATEEICLCFQCSEFLSNHDDKVDKLFKNVWPSFVWNFLTDESVLNIYGDYSWRFVPMKWRHWWIDSIKTTKDMECVSINNPPSIFKDITVEIN